MQYARKDQKRNKRHFGRSRLASSLNLLSPTYTFVSKCKTTRTHHSSAFLYPELHVIICCKDRIQRRNKTFPGDSRVNAELKTKVFENSSVSMIKNYVVNAHTLLLYVCADLTYLCIYRVFLNYCRCFRCLQFSNRKETKLLTEYESVNQKRLPILQKPKQLQRAPLSLHVTLKITGYGKHDNNQNHPVYQRYIFIHHIDQTKCF